MFAPYILVFCRIVICCVFALSSINKIRALPAFASTIATFRILPASLSMPAAFVLTALEAVVSLSMFASGTLLTIGFVTAIVLLVTFSAALNSVIRRGIHTTCTCFGASASPVSAIQLWRNAGFLVCAVGGAVTQTLLTDAAAPIGLAGWALVGFAAILFVFVWLQLDLVTQLLR